MPDKIRESFCQDLPADEALVMAVTQKAPLGSTFGDARLRPGVVEEAGQPDSDDRAQQPARFIVLQAPDLEVRQPLKLLARIARGEHRR